MQDAQSAALSNVERERKVTFVSADWGPGSNIKMEVLVARLPEWNEKPIANGSAFNDKGELTRSSLVPDRG